MSLDYQKYLLDKAYEQTPAETSASIRLFCQEIVFDGEPELLTSGEATGWIIREWPRVLLEARPHFGAIKFESLILPDTSDAFEADAPPFRCALSDEPFVTNYVTLLNQFDELCRESAAGGKWSLSNERVMDITKFSDKIHNAKIDVITWLFETTVPDAPCFCASNKPFKTCCHAALLGPA